jgi:hypothetical protein
MIVTPTKVTWFQAEPHWKKWSEMSAQFPGEIPLPPNWGGYVLKPERVEFWQGTPGAGDTIVSATRFCRPTRGYWNAFRPNFVHSLIPQCGGGR